MGEDVGVGGPSQALLWTTRVPLSIKEYSFREKEGTAAPRLLSEGAGPGERPQHSPPRVWTGTKGRHGLKYCFYKLGKDSGVMGLRFPS